MAKIPKAVTKEQYLLKSTFFYNMLRQNGYFELFMQIRKFDNIEGKLLDWENREEWNVSKDAWNIMKKNGISPTLLFLHPKVLTLYPTFLKYYRSVAMIPQKGLKAMSHVSNVDAIENAKTEPGTLPKEKILNLVKSINEVVSLVISLSSGLNENEIQGMMYATAGTNIDGSWRNQIGAEGERVIRSIILKELFLQKEINSVALIKPTTVKPVKDCDIQDLINDIDKIKTIHLTNGYSIHFSSEPDVTMFDTEGNIVGVIEIKSGLDPAGALERLGAMLKSFENTLSEYPNAITILVASCITEEVSNRLNASMAVRQTFITTNITSSDSEKRKFVNSLRVILKLITKTL